MSTSPADIELLMMQKLKLIETFSPSETCNIEDPDDPDNIEKCATQFDHVFYRNMWYARTDIATDGIVNEAVLPDKTVVKRAVYKIDNLNYDILSDSQIIVNFPSVKIKEKFRKDSQDARIAWTPNPLINFLINVQLQAGDTNIIDPFDTVWLMQHLMWNTEPGELPIVNDSIGNRPVMLEWSDNIPSQTCYHKLPFGYSYSTMSALPLYLFNKEIGLTKVITYHRNPIEKLLMMKITDDGVNWTNVSATSEILETGEFLPPTIEMSYHKLLAIEKAKNIDADAVVIPMHSVVSFTGKNRMILGKADAIPITTLHPLLGLFAVARNLESEKINHRSNFTTSTAVGSPGDGEYPITQFNMYYDNVLKFSKTSDSMRSNKMLSHFKNVPLIKGYLAYPYATRPFDIKYMVGPTIHPDLKAVSMLQYGENRSELSNNGSGSNFDDSDDTSLIKKLLAKSKTPSVVEKSDVNYDNTEYQTEIRALIFRDLIFEKDANGLRLFSMN